MESTANSSHRSAIASRSRAAKKSSLKRSKSMHCPKTRFNDSTTVQYNYPYSDPQQPQPYSAPEGNRNNHREPQYYASRRHHSTNDYNGDLENGHSNFGFVLNSSSHNLYNLYNSPAPIIATAGQARTSCSSGTSVASLNESQLTAQSRKPSDYYEDVFYDGNHNQSNGTGGGRSSQSQLCAQMSSLSLANGDSNHRIPSYRRYHGSSSSSSLINGQPDFGLMADTFEADKAEYEDDSLWEDFTLEPLTETKSATDRSSASNGKVKKSSGHESRSSRYRFYLIRQRNYPPLFLENMANRRRIYRVLVLGYPSAGKTSLIEQFGGWLAENERTRFNPAVSSELNERTNLLIHFLESDSFDKYLLQMPVIDYQPDMYLILYSVNNRDSFNSVKKTLVDLQRWDDVETKSIIIVANKSDLVRGRCVTRREGRELASANSCKYIETSCTISHNIDMLLQGIGSQICLKEEQQRKQKELEQSKANGSHKMKRRDSLLKRFLRKTAINKSKSCDNLHVL